jgi:undecaprenyl-diphosphatase
MSESAKVSRLERSLQVLARRVSWILASVAALLLWLFAQLSEELFYEQGPPSSVWTIDRTLLRAAAELRRPWLNPVAIDLTALGSPTLLTLFTLLAVAWALANGQRGSARHLIVASIGAAALNIMLKRALVRARPTEVPRLVEVASYSYPSGHSMASAAILTTLAIVFSRQVRSVRRKLACGLVAALLVLLIGASRIYLGVHYPSDVAAGIAVGLAWALLLELAATQLRKRYEASQP